MNRAELNSAEPIGAATSRWLKLVGVLGICGCATPLYQEPAGDSIAQIEFVDDTAKPMGIYLYGDARECTDRTRAGWVEPKSQRRLAVPAGKALAFSVSMDTGQVSPLLVFGAVGGLVFAATYKGCMPTLEFVPEAGRTYVFRTDSDGKDCRHRFFEKPAAPERQGEELPVALTQREWIRPFDDASPSCKKK